MTDLNVKEDCRSWSKTKNKGPVKKLGFQSEQRDKKVEATMTAREYGIETLILSPSNSNDNDLRPIE